MGYINQPGYLDDIVTSGIATFPALGLDVKVRISVRDTRRFIARWKEGMVNISVPQGTTGRQIDEWLLSIRTKLMARRPAVAFEPGTELTINEMHFTFKWQSLKPQTIFLQGKTLEPVIMIGSDLDWQDIETVRIVSRLMKIVAHTVAPNILIRRAQELAAEVGVSPASIKISRGVRTLGTCNRRGEITLSSMCMFLTPDLRDMIILHEFTHLTHMDHSPRFHQLLNSYLGGREKELDRALKNFNWPLMK